MKRKCTRPHSCFIGKHCFNQLTLIGKPAKNVCAHFLGGKRGCMEKIFFRKSCRKTRKLNVLFTCIHLVLPHFRLPRPTKMAEIGNSITFIWSSLGPRLKFRILPTVLSALIFSAGVKVRMLRAASWQKLQWVRLSFFCFSKKLRQNEWNANALMLLCCFLLFSSLGDAINDFLRLDTNFYSFSSKGSCGI